MGNRTVDVEAIVGEYAKAAFCSVKDFYEMQDGVLTVRPLDEISETAAGAIQSIKETKDGVELKLYDKYKALEAIAELLGLKEASEEEMQIIVQHNVPRPPEKEEEDETNARLSADRETEAIPRIERG